MKKVKVTDKELIKLIKILGSTRVKYLWIDSKIELTNKQLDFLINEGRNYEED